MDVFISYSRSDAQQALGLQAALNKIGISTYLDTDHLETGSSFPDRLDTAIREAGVVMALLSRAALKSEWCQKERALA